MARTALWQSVKKAHPNLTDKQVDQLLHEAAQRERSLVLGGMPFPQARELANAELFEGVDPWAGDEEYGPVT